MIIFVGKVSSYSAGQPGTFMRSLDPANSPALGYLPDSIACGKIHLAVLFVCLRNVFRVDFG